MLLVLVVTAGGPPVALQTVAVGVVTCRVITVDMTDPRVRVDLILAQGFPGGDESFASMLSRTRPVAAINGAYFSKQTLLPIGDLAQRGELRHSGRMGTVFTLDAQRRMDIQRVVRHRTYQWPEAQVALGCGPALVLDGQIDVRWADEGFRDPHVTGRTARMGLGYTERGKLKLVNAAAPLSFEGFARVMQSLGCHEAMNLDSGASQALYFQGKTLLRPGRKLTTVLGVWVDPLSPAR